MKTQKQWFDEYAISHQNSTNKKIHYICVPAIFISIIGLLMCIPNKIIRTILPITNPIVENWGFIAVIFILLFYARLSVKTGIYMSLFSGFCLVFNFFISIYFSLFYFSIAVFIIAWIGQFYGHKIEGKKPSFLKDLQFLLIGPAWVIHNITNNKQK